jgi:signal peptidase I
VTKKDTHQSEKELNWKNVGKSGRDTIESIIIAFILAFVFRAFIVEAYRIPTGSMAPTLYGAHKTRFCRDCGYKYAYEIQQILQGNTLVNQGPERNICPTCRAEDEPLRIMQNGKILVDGGDRILVMKLGFELCELFPSLRPYLGPKRWDVVVFKNPADPSINFIKRLIGLPGEKIELIDGDVFANDKIVHKTSTADDSLWFIVHDCDYLPTRRSRVEPEDIPGWAAVDNISRQLWDTTGRVLIFRGKEKNIPGSIYFTGMIKDYYAYDNPMRSYNERFIVSDLKLQTMFVPHEGNGAIELILGKRDDVFVVKISAEGSAELLQTPKTDFLSGTYKLKSLLKTQIPPFTRRAPHILELENVDYRIRLSVNNKIVLETTDAQYAPNPDALRLAPLESFSPIVRISASGLDAQFWHTRLFRDIYYQSVTFGEKEDEFGQNPLYKHKGIGTTGFPVELGPNDYFVLGDNSPESKDSRLWWQVGPHLKQKYEAHQYSLGTVPSDQMVGKAFFVYWPAGYRIFSTGPGIIPNVGDMRFIR